MYIYLYMCVYTYLHICVRIDICIHTYIHTYILPNSNKASQAVFEKITVLLQYP